MEIIVGTYERYILGYKLVETTNGVQLKSSFSTEAHLGSIRCLATSSKYLVSGSTDETIRVFNLKTRKDVGSLTQHEGTVTCLKFFHDDHLVSGSDDNTICVWSTSNWQCLKTLRGHKNSISDLTIHPSGKLLLSVAKDKTLKTWNLVKGRSAYVTNIKSVAQLVNWSPDGIHFIVVFDSRFDVYNTVTACITYSVNSKKKFSSLVFLTENIIAIAESENIAFYHIGNKCFVNTFTAHENRIKSITCVLVSTDETHIRWLISISSDGFVKVWKCNLENIKEIPILITAIDTTCRPTCLTVWETDSLSNENKTEKLTVKQDLKTKVENECDSSHPVKTKKLCKNKSKN